MHNVIKKDLKYCCLWDVTLVLMKLRELHPTSVIKSSQLATSHAVIRAY